MKKLSVLILAVLFVGVGCGDKKPGSKVVDDELGALDPQSVEALSLLEGPWCMGQKNSRGVQYELRSFFKDNGTVVTKQYELNRGVRVKQVGEAIASDWRLEGQKLMTATKGVVANSLLSFRSERGARYMRIADDDGSNYDYYGCP